ncbi:MAG: M56 family metallopeptidase [Acidimicrobiia bacterium]
MTAALLVLTGWVLTILPGVYHRTARLESRRWARSAATSLWVGLLSVEVGLVALATPAALRALHVPAIAGVCDNLIGPFTLGGNVGAIVAGTLATILALRVVRAARHSYRSTLAVAVEPWLGRHEDRGDFDLVVLPTDHLLAMSVPGVHGQVVISQGLVDSLASDQLEVVIEHEATHQRNRHWRHTMLASVVERSFAPFRGPTRSADALRRSLEAWADDGAAGDSAHRRATVRRAVLHITQSCSTTASGMPDSLRERVRRLQAPPRSLPLTTRVSILLPIAALLLVSGILASGAIVGVHHAGVLDQLC